MKRKPANMKYTDLCIYIDNTMYERDEDNNPTSLRELTPEEIEKVYYYLYNLIYALSVKKRLFTNKFDYDAFCLETAGAVYMRLSKDNQNFDPDAKQNKAIKSIKNYLDTALGFMAINWRQTNYLDIINPEYDSFDAVNGVQGYVLNQATKTYDENKAAAYQELIKNLPSYIIKSADNSIFKNNKLAKHELILSEYLSLCNCLSLTYKQHKYSENRQKDKILAQLKERDTFTKVFSSNPLLTMDMVELQLKKSLFLMEDDANKIQHDYTPSDEEINDILESAFPTYEMDQGGK